MSSEFDPKPKPGKPFSEDDARTSSISSASELSRPLEEGEDPIERLLNVYDGLSNENKRKLRDYNQSQKDHVDRAKQGE